MYNLTMKNDIQKKIAVLIAKATGLAGDESEHLLEIPPDSAMGDYAFPCFQLSKQLKKAPYVIAQDVAEEITRHLPSMLDRAIASGPYVNFFLSAHGLAGLLLGKKAVVKKTSKKETVIIEFV